jgi:8-oxo-dGTP pyrophosphatase MutT (NUDIX family)
MSMEAFEQEARRLMAETSLKTRFYSGFGIVADAEGFELTLRVHQLWDVKETFRISSAGVVLLTQNSEDVPSLLLVNEEEGRWDLPAGGVESFDRTPEETALREFGEETGYEIGPDYLLPLTFAVKKDTKRAGVQYLAVAALQGFAPTHSDRQGRFYGRNEIAGVNIALEPLRVALSAKYSLLAHSHHPWAYLQTRAAILEKLTLAKEAGWPNSATPLAT